MELAFDAGSWWSYALVFLAAAVPLLDVPLVIPVAVLAGMPPVPTTLLAFAGNLSTVVVVAVAGEQGMAWWRRRRPARTEQPSRMRRARRMAQRWGVPGLALVAPIATGTHIATLAATAIGAARNRVLCWMAAGLAVWAVASAAAAVLGLQVLPW